VLAACLESVRDVVDEIVVVDTGSVDDSVAIAASMGAVVGHHPWNDDFAAARNAGLDLASGEWILYIDADERLAPVTRRDVEALLTDAPEIAFRLLLRPTEGATPYREYRLWRSDPRIRFEGVIHEKVVPAIHAVGDADRRPIGVCDLLLEHVGYEGDQTRKHRRNLPLLRTQLAREPDNIFNWHHLARVLTGLGSPTEAEEALAHGVELARSKPFVDPLGVLVFSDLISLRYQRGEDVTDLLSDARMRYPDNWILVWLEARVLIDQGRYDEALARFDQLAAVDTSRLADVDGGPSYDARLFDDLAHGGRGLCLFRLERYAESAEAYAEAARLAPNDPTYRTKQHLARTRANSPNR
jgi:tetratricopeptide (TPR) repeat protein